MHVYIHVANCWKKHGSSYATKQTKCKHYNIAVVTAKQGGAGG